MNATYASHALFLLGRDVWLAEAWVEAKRDARELAADHGYPLEADDVEAGR